MSFSAHYLQKCYGNLNVKDTKNGKCTSIYLTKIQLVNVCPKQYHADGNIHNHRKTAKHCAATMSLLGIITFACPPRPKWDGNLLRTIVS